MRILVMLVVIVTAACDGKTKPSPPRPELIQTVRDLADRVCGCGTDMECVRPIRDNEWEPNKRTILRHGLAGAEQAAFDAELLRLRQCGDAAGLTIWQ